MTEGDRVVWILLVGWSECVYLVTVFFVFLRVVVCTRSGYSVRIFPGLRQV